MTGCEALDAVLYENGTYDEIQHLRVTMETDNGKIDVLKKSFDKVAGSMRKCVEKLVEKDRMDKAIEVSRGDISRVAGIDTSLSILNLVKTKITERPVIRHAENLEALYKNALSYKKDFIEAYNRRGSLGGNFVYVVYTANVKLFVQGVSHLISIISGQMKKSNVLDNYIPKMLNGYRNGGLRKWCQFFLGGKESVKEDAGIIIGALLIGSVITVAFMLRVIVFYYYWQRTSMAEYFEQQSNYLKLRSEEIAKSNSFDKYKKQSIINSQKVWADRFMKLSDWFAVADIEAEKKSQAEEKEANKDINPGSVDVPNTGMDFF